MLRRCTIALARARGASSGAAAAAGPFDPYKILGIPPTSTPEEAKKAYHKLALRFHPDAAEGNKERFQAVQEAHEAIKGGWSPGQSSSEQASGGEEGAGGRRYKSTYVYEEPGSTSDNYVSSNPTLQRNLQLLMLTCFAVFMLRMIMHLTRKPEAPAQHLPSGAPDLSGIMLRDPSTPGKDPLGRSATSIHDEGDAEWRRYKERTNGSGSGEGVFRFDNSVGDIRKQ